MDKLFNIFIKWDYDDTNNWRSKMIEIGPNLAESIGCIIITIGVLIIWRWKR